MSPFITQEEIEKYGNLDLLAKQVVEGFITGLHKSPYHGFSVEFSEYRQYNPGDHPRSIDWKLYGRTDKLFVKKYEEETNLRCHMILDISSSMSARVYAMDKLKFSIYATAVIMNLLKRQRDAFGVSLYDDELRYHTDDRSNEKHYRMIIEQLDRVLKKDILNTSTRTDRILHLIAEQLHKRSLVILFSDLFSHTDDQQSFFDALQHLKFKKNEVILFHVTDKKYELDFDFDYRPYHFIDPETGAEIKMNPASLKESYLEKIQALTNELKIKCAQYKIDLVEVDSNAGFHQVLLPFLLKRSKMY